MFLIILTKNSCLLIATFIDFICKVNILSKFIALFFFEIVLLSNRIENTIKINNKYFDEFLIRVNVNKIFDFFKIRLLSQLDIL